MPCHHSWGRAIFYLASLTLPPLMRSQIAFILCYRIVFRPRQCICFRNDCLSSSLLKWPLSTYQVQVYQGVLCSLVQGGVLSVKQMFWQLMQIYLCLLYWDYASDRNPNLYNQFLWQFLLFLHCFSLFVNVPVNVNDSTNPLHHL